LPPPPRRRHTLDDRDIRRPGRWLALTLALAALTLALLTIQSPAAADSPDADVVTVDADWPLIPDGIEAGGQFRLLFSTSKTTKGDRDASNYHSFVKKAAQRGHRFVREYADAFAALAAVGGSGIRAVAGIERGSAAAAAPVYWLGGAQAADSAESLLGGAWTGDRTDQHGRARADRWHWTGRHAKSGHRLGAERPGIGAKTLNGNALAAQRTLAAERKLPVYALSAVFEVAAPRQTNLNNNDDGIQFFQTPEVTVSFSVTSNVTEGDPATLTASIQTGTVASTALTIPFTIINGPGVAAGTDYTAPSTSSVTFPVGATTSGADSAKTAAVITINDNIDQPNGRYFTFVPDLSSNRIQRATGDSASLRVNVRDNDRTVVSISGLSTRIYEDDDDGSATFTVTLGRELEPGETANVKLALTHAINDSQTPTSNIFTLSAGGTGITYNNVTLVVTFTRPSNGDTDGDGNVDGDDTVQVATISMTPAAGEDGNKRDDTVNAGLAGGEFLSPTNSGLEGGITGTGVHSRPHQPMTVVDAGELLVWTDWVPLTPQPAGFPAIGIPGHPPVNYASGEKNYWFGRDLWIEPIGSKHQIYIWLTKPTHEEVVVSMNFSNNHLSVSGDAATITRFTHATEAKVTFSVGEGPCSGTGSSRVHYGGPYGCAAVIELERVLPAHQSGCPAVTLPTSTGSVYGNPSDNTLRVALPQTHLNASATSRDWTTVKNSRANAYKSSGVCPAGRISTKKPAFPR